MEKLIVDRIEEGVTILEKEDLSHIALPTADFQFPLSEGDILLYDGVDYIKDEAEKATVKNKMLLMQQKLKEKSKNK